MQATWQAGSHTPLDVWPPAQVVFGLERLVDLTIAKAVPPVAYGTTVTIRFVNNVIGKSAVNISTSLVFPELLNRRGHAKLCQLGSCS
jgi:hypothetical protein